MEEEISEQVEEVSHTPLLDDANKTTAELKEQLDRKEELLKREEQLLVKQTLGGHANAGKPEEVKEETATEYKDRVMANNG